MAVDRGSRIFDGSIKGIIPGAHRKVGKGLKKKFRRTLRAGMQDGWQRKRAGGLRPQLRSSKYELRKELDN